MTEELPIKSLEGTADELTNECQVLIGQLANAIYDIYIFRERLDYFPGPDRLQIPHFMDGLLEKIQVSLKKLIDKNNTFERDVKEAKGVNIQDSWLKVQKGQINELKDKFFGIFSSCRRLICDISERIHKNIEELLSTNPKKLLEVETLTTQLQELIAVWHYFRNPYAKDEETTFMDALKRIQIFIEETRFDLLTKYSTELEIQRQIYKGDEKKRRIFPSPLNLSSPADLKADTPPITDLKKEQLQGILDTKLLKQALENIDEEEKKEKSRRSNDSKPKPQQEPQDNKTLSDIKELRAEYISSQENLIRAFTEYQDALNKFPSPTMIPNLRSFMIEHLKISDKVRESNLPGNLDFEDKKRSNRDLVALYVRSSAANLKTIHETLMAEANEVGKSPNDIVSATTTYETVKQKLILLREFTKNFIPTPPISQDLAILIDTNILRVEKFLLRLEQIDPHLVQATIDSLKESQKPTITPIPAISAQNSTEPDQTDDEDDDDDEAQELAAIALSLSVNELDAKEVAANVCSCDEENEEDEEGRLQKALALSRTGSTGSGEETNLESVIPTSVSEARGSDALSVKALIDRGGPLDVKVTPRPATPPPVAAPSTPAPGPK